MQPFRDLRVWKRAHELVLKTYAVTAGFPKEERFGITDQLRRAIVSIPANIAEGSKRRRSADYARFINIAEGSAAEAEYLFLLCRDLGLTRSDTIEPLLVETDAV